MTQRLLPLLLAAAALTATTAPATAATLPATTTATSTAAPNPCGYSPRQNLKLRTEPAGPGIGVITPKDGVHLVTERGEWARVRLDLRSETGLAAGTTGWVATRNLEPAVCMTLD